MFWDRVAGVYDLFVNVVNRKTHKALRRIVAELIGPEDRVLECACGTGLLTGVIAGRCKALTATDFAPKMLKTGGEKLRGPWKHHLSPGGHHRAGRAGRGL